jgi:hypothetical protein
MSLIEFTIHTETVEEIENFLSYKLQNCEEFHLSSC